MFESVTFSVVLSCYEFKSLCFLLTLELFLLRIMTYNSQNISFSSTIACKISVAILSRYIHICKITNCMHRCVQLTPLPMCVQLTPLPICVQLTLLRICNSTKPSKISVS